MSYILSEDGMTAGSLWDTDVLILILTSKVRSGLHIWKQQLSRHHSVLCSFLSTVPHLTEDGEEFLAEHADGRSSGAWQRAAERGKSCWAWRSEAGCVCCQGRGTQKHYGYRRVFLASSTAGGRGTGFGHQAEPRRGRGSSPAEIKRIAPAGTTASRGRHADRVP